MEARQSDAIARLYARWRLALSAGLSWRETLRLLGAESESTAVQTRVRHLVRGLEGGQTLAESVRAAPVSFSRVEMALIELGERRGRLDECLQGLRELYELEWRVLLEARRVMAYPVASLAAVALIAPIPLAVNGTMLRYLAAAVPAFVLALALGAISALGLFSRERSKQRWAMSRFCRALAIVLETGTSLDEAVWLATDVLDRPTLEARLRAIPRPAWRQQPLADTLAATGAVPHVVIEMLRTAEGTGNTEDTLRRLAALYEEGAV